MYVCMHAVYRRPVSKHYETDEKHSSLLLCNSSSYLRTSLTMTSMYVISSSPAVCCLENSPCAEIARSLGTSVCLQFRSDLFGDSGRIMYAVSSSSSSVISLLCIKESISHVKCRIYDVAAFKIQTGFGA